MSENSIPGPDEFGKERKNILIEVDHLRWTFKSLVNERQQLLESSPEHQFRLNLFAAELDCFRGIYHARPHELAELFDRLGWPEIPSSQLLDQQSDSSEIAKWYQPISFTPPNNFSHRIQYDDDSVTRVEYHFMPKKEKPVRPDLKPLPMYGIWVERIQTINGSIDASASHNVTEDEVYALAELMGLMQQPYHNLYKQFGETE